MLLPGAVSAYAYDLCSRSIQATTNLRLIDAPVALLVSVFRS